MPGPGAGPSRRSHTKSRKGCKTCKRRHIRCDETFPQCRNCMKHRVQCDYMENIGSDTESQSSPEQPVLMLTPGSENRVDVWQETGGFPYPELQVFPLPQTHEYSRNELRLIDHLSSISKDLLLKNSTNLTIWTQKMPKFLSIASTYPYVMHALLSFSANHLAWLNRSTEIRNLHIQHGSIALRGLHEAIGSFSHTNADAVLAASLLMLWQATNWRSWFSLRAGIRSILTAMQSWNHESLFAEYIAEDDLTPSSMLAHSQRAPASPPERSTILQKAVYALHRLQVAVAGQELESYWVNQLVNYVQGLQSANPAETAEDQFGQLYYLRKWLFWVPISLLQRPRGQATAMLTLAHFYAIALALEPLFPELGSSFCGILVLSPLQAILSVTNAMQSEQSLGPASHEIATMMQFPQQVAYNYKTRPSQTQQMGMRQQQGTPVVSLSPDTLSYATIGNISPAFAPPALHLGTPQSASSSQSGFLEVPSTQQGFGYNTQGWGVPSPCFPAQTYGNQDDQLFGYMSSMGNFRGGFVPASIGT